MSPVAVLARRGRPAAIVTGVTGARKSEQLVRPSFGASTRKVFTP
jgi:hypothetical protein